MKTLSVEQVKDVNGGVAPIIKIGILATTGTGVGFGGGYWANRD